MEIVLLQEVVASYASNWYRIAATTGTETIRIGDVFREKGSGDGAEEIRIEAFEISAIAGASRVLVNRAHNRVAPQSYRLGAVLRRLEPEPVLAGKTTKKRSDQGLNDLLADV